MEELREKANCYAEENVISVLKEALTRVYSDGYRDGYKDCEGKISIDLHDNKAEFVDLGLPSGTLWSTDYETEGGNYIYLPYEDAVKFNIPNKEQFQELLDLCQWEYKYVHHSLREYTCIGPNGRYIVFSSKGYQLAGTYRDSVINLFWVKSDKETSLKDAAYLFFHNKDIKELKEIFSGNKLPLRLVKSK